ncbi:MAG TPA: LPS export ABC transporter permease LptG [Methylomirabilota bacterium]|jgi:LPS export ABC transporter permease LptG/LPS export ABC transporter permease LptF|nr:LPS export ABC transporter permease LptG [Methylomirabilota bacterium]
MRLPGLTVLDRYLLRELIAPFALGVTLFTFFLIIDRLYQLTELVITKGVPFHLVLQLLVFMLPSFLAYTLPMALLVAVLLAGARMAADLEIVACKAAGLSLWRLFRPVLVAGLLVSLAGAGLTLYLTPAANRLFQQQLFVILQSRAVSALTERVFNTSFSDVMIYVEEISASQVGLRGVIVSDERDPSVSRIITAREGRLIPDEPQRRITLRLIDGAVNEADVVPASPQAAGGAAGPKRYRYTAFAIYDMTLSLESSLKGIGRLEKPERDLGTAALRERIAALSQDPQSRMVFETELHKRQALPVAALVFALVAFPLAVRSHRGGRSVAFIATLGILLFYYLTLTSLESLALRQGMPLGLAIWAPNILLAAIGTVMMVVTARELRAPRLHRVWQISNALWEHLPRPRTGRRRRRGGGIDTTFIIDRYLLRQFLGFVAMGLLVATTLIIVVDLVSTLDRYLRIKPPLLYIAEHFLFLIPIALHQGLPVVMLIATIFLFLTLSRWHELTALKAAGMSLYRISAPILITGLLASIGAGLFQEFALPILSTGREEVDRVKIRGQLPRHLQTRTRLWLRSAERRFYRVELLNPASQDLYGITILEVDGDFRLVSRIDARHAHWSPDGWEFVDGTIRELDTTGQVTTVPFVRTAVELEESIQDFTDVQKRPTEMSYRELRDYVAKLEAAGFRVTKYLVGMYGKLSGPLESLIMILVAIPFALQAPRGGRLYGTGLAIAIMAGYLVVDRSARALGQAELLPPLLAAWTANVIFLGVGTALFLRSRT